MKWLDAVQKRRFPNKLGTRNYLVEWSIALKCHMTMQIKNCEFNSWLCRFFLHPIRQQSPHGVRADQMLVLVRASPSKGISSSDSPRQSMCLSKKCSDSTQTSTQK